MEGQVHRVFPQVRALATERGSRLRRWERTVRDYGQYTANTGRDSRAYVTLTWGETLST
jgi:hypothetical protein